AAGERPLDLEGGPGGRLGLREDAEQLVAPGVDLPAPRLGDRPALHVPRLGEDGRIVGSEPLGEPRRVLDVAEEERQGHGDTGNSARTTVPRPGRLSTANLPPSASTRSRRPRSPDPTSGSTPPTPLSEISTTAQLPERSTRTRADSARACFTTLAIASETT